MKEESTCLSPLSPLSRRLLDRPLAPPRRLPSGPFKVLEAPHLQDDFYLNLVDWGAQNLLAVGLGSAVYIWNASTGGVSRLCDLGLETVACVNWNARGNYLAVGSSGGHLSLWDVSRRSLVRKYGGHLGRIGSASWNDTTLSSGSRDRVILNRDIREPPEYSAKFTGHRQEICGLKWSPHSCALASGGNDNTVLLWDPRGSPHPVLRFSEHHAAVKALAWSPHQRSLLASGGGTADRTIRLWDTGKGHGLQAWDTGSQVCNLAWAPGVNELVSTHGYSQNQIMVWAPSSPKVLSPVGVLNGHSMRVLYLALSPDGQTVVTGAGDETLRFWNLFPRTSQKEGKALTLLYPIR